MTMPSKPIVLTDDEIEDIRFCLASMADRDEKMADNFSGDVAGALLQQRDRFRELARKITSEPQGGV